MVRRTVRGWVLGACAIGAASAGAGSGVGFASCAIFSSSDCAASTSLVTLVSKLRAAGAILLGKVNCDEFGMGSSTERSAYKPTRNPWDPTRSPGGSSGGSGAAVGNPTSRPSPRSASTTTGSELRRARPRSVSTIAFAILRPGARPRRSGFPPVRR